MILARILAQADFGLMALVLTASVLLEALSDVGIRQSIIQNKRGFEPEYLNTAWWLQTVRGAVIYVIAFLAAPAISSFYGQPELTLFLRVAISAVVFNGLMSPGTHALEKQLQYGRWVLIIQGSAAFGAVFTIIIAIWIRNAWALVIGFTLEAALRCLMSFVLCPFCPKFRIDRSSLFELLRYARGMLGVTVLTIAALKTDVIVLGKVVSTEQLGMYILAFALAQQPAAMFGQTIARVLLSAFAERQDDKPFLRRSVTRVIRYTLLLGIPLAAGATIWGRQLLSLVYGAPYAAVAMPFGILCFSTVFSVQGVVLSKIYLALGKPHVHRRLTAILALLIVVFICPGAILFGLAGAALGLLLANAISVGIQAIWMRHAIGLRFRDYMNCFIPNVLVQH
jgi:O-antigen/teichoic acid export membrane protein